MKKFRCIKAFFIIEILLVLPSCSKGEYSTYRTVDQAPPDNVTQVAANHGDTLLDSIINLSEGYVDSSTRTGTGGGSAQLSSLVLGVVTPEFSRTLTFGRKVNGEKPSELDIYPVSSIAKMFTGLIAAKGVANNDFNENTPIRVLLKTDLSPLVGNLTIGQILTHRAGFKESPTNLHHKEFPNSPGTNYSRRELIACMQKQGCSFSSTLAGHYSYSNLGMGLLGIALADFYDKSYEQLIAENFARDLGMMDTHTRAFVANETRIVKGLTTNNAEVPPATMGVLAGAGEILSTGRDMLILLETMIKPPAHWEDAVRIATTPLSEGRQKIGYAIEIRNIQSMTIFGKAGDQAGYSSLIMWSPELQAGAFALTNKGMATKTLASLLREVMQEIKTSSGNKLAGSSESKSQRRSRYRR